MTAAVYHCDPIIVLLQFEFVFIFYVNFKVLLIINIVNYVFNMPSFY